MLCDYLIPKEVMHPNHLDAYDDPLVAGILKLWFENNKPLILKDWYLWKTKQYTTLDSVIDEITLYYENKSLLTISNVKIIYTCCMNNLDNKIIYTHRCGRTTSEMIYQFKIKLTQLQKMYHIMKN